MRGLNTKISVLNVAVSDCEYDIIALSETWLHGDVVNTELFPDNYVIYRKDRKFQEVHKEKGGGVLLAVKNFIKSEEKDTSVCNSQFPSIDLLVISCQINYKRFYILVVYIPDYTSLSDFESFFESLEQLDYLYSNSIILGDFNASKFVDNDICDSHTAVLNNFLNLFGLVQYNDIFNKLGRLLDLVISHYICEVKRDELPLLREDDHHPALMISVANIFVKEPKFGSNVYQQSYNFRKSNFPALYRELYETNWDTLLTFNDVDTVLDSFYEHLLGLFNKHIPKYRTHSHSYPPWFNADIIRNIKLKAKYRKKYRIRNNVTDLIEFQRLRRTIKNQIKTSYNQYIERIQLSLTHDPRKFWSYVHAKNNSSRIPGQMIYQSNTIEHPQNIINAFGEYFSSVYQSSQSLTNKSSQSSSVNNIYFYPICESEVITACKKLKDKMTSGTDNIPSFIVKDCAGVLSCPLAKIFNLCLNNKQYPSVWKETKICPVYKSGRKDNIENYRPISIISNLSKVFEIILYNRIYPLISRQLSQYQHGFVSKRSTVTNLFIMTQYISECLDKGGQVDVIYTDFSKAFDSLHHNILISKMKAFGFSKDATDFLKSYLTDRIQFVSYNGYKSDKYFQTSGVPQGSNLGPIMFLMFINDLCENITTGRLCYADDLKLFSSINVESDCYRLQNQLKYVQTWCDENELSLNANKCQILSYTRKKNIFHFPYIIKGSNLKRVNVTKDLGVTFDQKLTFNEHISLKVCDALKSYGFIVRNCRNITNIKAIKLLYFSFVRSKLEYASIIWSPFYNVHNQIIERVQRKFLKFLTFKVDGSYPERGVANNELCSRFNLISLKTRRNCSSVIFLYKLLHNFIDCSDILEQISFNVPSYPTRNIVTFRQPQARTNIMLNSPMYVMCKNFNDICMYCDIFNCSLNQFIILANRYLKD